MDMGKLPSLMKNLAPEIEASRNQANVQRI